MADVKIKLGKCRNYKCRKLPNKCMQIGNLLCQCSPPHTRSEDAMTFNIKTFRTELENFRNTHNVKDYVIDNPEWKYVADDFAVKLGIKSPRIIRVPTNFVNALTSMDGDIFVSDGLMKMLDCTHCGAPSRPMQATIAHEMGHIKYDMKHLKNISYLPQTVLKHTLWLTMPVATILAYGLYKHAVNSIPPDQLTKDKEGDKRILGHVDMTIAATLQDEQRDIDKNKGNPDYLTWLNRNLYDAHYWVAGALGVGLGIAAHKYVGKVTEFRADRVAVELMGEINSFNILKDRFPKEAYKVWSEMNTTPIAATFGERLERFMKTEMYFLKNKILGIHPSWQERAEKAGAHLSRLKQTGRPIDVHPF